MRTRSWSGRRISLKPRSDFDRVVPPMTDTVVKRYPGKTALACWALSIFWMFFGADYLVRPLGLGWAILSVFVVQLLLGVFYARAAARLIHWRWRNVTIYPNVFDRVMMTAWRVVAWQWATIFDIFARGSNLESPGSIGGMIAGIFTGPLRKDAAKAAKLRESAELLSKTAAMETVPADERELLMAQVSDMLEQAAALDPESSRSSRSSHYF